jgi:hypothetical protein
MAHGKGKREGLDALLECAWEGQHKRKKWAEAHPPMSNKPENNLPPEHPTIPLWESTLLWGLFSFIVTVVLAVIAAMVKDLRWLLFVCIVPSGIFWWVLWGGLLKTKRNVLFGLSEVATVIGLLWLYSFLSPIGPLEITIRPIERGRISTVIFDVTNGPDELNSVDLICVENRVTDVNGNLSMNNQAVSEFVPKLKPGERYARTCPWNFGRNVVGVNVEFRMEFSTTSTNQKFIDAKYHLESDAFKRYWWIRDGFEQGEASRTIPKN